MTLLFWYESSSWVDIRSNVERQLPGRGLKDSVGVGEVGYGELQTNYIVTPP